MNLRDLRYLVALDETRHFRKAAERCFVTQPTLSTQLRKLEEELGVQLVERESGGVRMTRAGTEIVARARRVLQEADGIVTFAREQRDPMTGSLQIGLIPTVAPYLLPYIVEPLHEAFPKLELLLVEAQTERLLEKLAAGELDAGILALPVDDEAVHTRALYDEAFFVALPRGHRLAQKKLLRVADLKDEPMLLLEDGHCLRDQALEVCALAEIHERTDFRATSLETLRQMVAAGVGITLLPELAAPRPVAGQQAALEIRALAPPAPSRTIGLVWRKSSARVETIQRLGDLVEELMRMGRAA